MRSLSDGLELDGGRRGLPRALDDAVIRAVQTTLFWSFHDSWYDAHKMTHSTYTLLLPRHKRSLSSPPFPPTPQPAQDAVKASWKSRGMSLSPHLPLERTVLPEAVRMASRSRAPCHIRFVSLFFLLATCPTP